MATRHHRKRAVWIVAAVVILSLVTAAWIYPDSTAPRQPADPPERRTIACTSMCIGSGMILIAAAKGYFKAEGLDVTLQPHTSGRNALDSVLHGKADLATGGKAPLMFTVMKGEPASIVATIVTGSDVYGIVARKDRGIATPADLKGKRIGATFGTNRRFFNDAVLIEHKIPVREVRIMNFQPQELADALRAYDLHANCYIAKPVDFDQFMKVVRLIDDFWLSVVALPRTA